MTETASTTGTSASKKAGREPADDSARAEDTPPEAAASGEAETVSAGAGDAGGTEDAAAVEDAAAADADAAPALSEARAGDEPTVADASAGSGEPNPAPDSGDPTGAADADPPALEPAAAAAAARGPEQPNRPAFTRPPGMVPPPEKLDEADSRSPWSGNSPVSGAPASGVPASGGPVSGPPASGPWSGIGGYLPASSSAPVSAPPRVTGRQPASGINVRPYGADGSGAGGTPVGTAPIGEPIRPRPAATPRGPRRARLNLKRIDPWSVMKFSFAVSLVLFIVVIVAASVLYLALDAMGVFSSINETVAELIQSGAGETTETFRITAQGVIGTAAVLGALNVLLFTSLATLGSFIYNVCADLVGGVEVTLAERD